LRSPMHFEESSPSFSPESIPSRDWSGPVTPLALGQGGNGVGCEEALDVIARSAAR
jgi:hypothetical protein